MTPPGTWSLALTAVLALAGQDAAPPAVGLPSGRAADAVARIPADLEPAAIAVLGWPAWDAAEWDAAAPWQRWSELVVEEAEGPRLDPGRRAALALVAALQGRHVDAWDHFAATADEPGVAAALLPRLFPGVPADAPAGRGGRPGELPDGVLLRPALPPLWLESPIGRARVRSMRVDGLRIGAATCDLELKVEADGVEIAFQHREGGEARVRVVLPLSHDRELRSLFVDWERTAIEPAVAGEPIELALQPQGEDSETGGETTVWARFEPRRLAWPAPGGEPRMTVQLRRAGIALEHDPGDPLEPRLLHLADALGVVLRIPIAARARDGAPPEGRLGTPPLRVAFAASEPEALRQGRLAFLASAAERYALAR